MRETWTQTGRAPSASIIAPMSLEQAPLEPEDNADPNWFAPIATFIAWPADLFNQIAKLKRIRRTTRFKSNWRDHEQDLRQREWMRDQILAAGAAQLLAGKELDLNAFIPSTEPPADYGEPCPKTPFEMNRRFLAMALFNADPEPAICAHAKRIARCEGIDLDNPLAAHGSKDSALCAAAHPAPVGIAASKALTLSRAQGARRSKGERGQTHVRGPPEPSKNPIRPNSHSPARPHPHA